MVLQLQAAEWRSPLPGGAAVAAAAAVGGVHCSRHA